jgi:hypothetical protein
MLARFTTNRAQALRLISATVVFSGLLIFYFSARHLFPTISISHLPTFRSPEEEIPNIVHFAHLIPGPANATDSKEIKFKFRNFIAIYSAYYHLHPSTIYIHTDAAPSTIANVKNSTDKYTKIIANIPNVVFNHEVIEDFTTKGFEIKTMAAKSDFLRTRVMRKWGGIYLDIDAYVIRDLSPLRKAGYKNVVGRQVDKKVACGTFLSVPGSDLVTAYNMLQPLVFNGDWTPHSVDLMTTLAYDFSVREKEVLILEHEAFFPGGWDPLDLEIMYKANSQDERTVGNEVPLANGSRTQIEDYVKGFKLRTDRGWKYDWRVSYVMHGWGSGMHGQAFEKNFGKFGGVTPRYVLEGNSNFGRAVYAAVKDALDSGIINLED